MKSIFVCLLVALQAIAVEPPVTALAIAPDGKSVVVGSQAGVQVRSLPDLKLSRTIVTDFSNIHDIAFSPDGTLLTIAGGSPAEKGGVELVTWTERKDQFQHSKLHKDVVHAIAWSSDSKLLATASADQKACILDANTGRTKFVLEGHSRGVLAVVFLPGDKQVVTAGADETLRVWDYTTGLLERNLSHHTKAVTGLAVRPSKDKSAEPLLASISDDRTVRIWQPALGRMVRFARVDSEPRAIAWTADGSRIVIACKDGSLRVIDPESVEVLATIPVLDGIAHSLVIAPDGDVLVGGRNGQIKRTQLPSTKR